MKYSYQSRKYVRLIDWIAGNDTVEPTDTLEDIAGYRTVMLVADCYDLKPLQVAKDVWTCRHTTTITMKEEVQQSTQQEIGPEGA